jgi:molybdopterin synthase catalytic subunit
VQVEVLYFAVLRERLAREREALELPPGCTVAGALDCLAAAHPALPPLLGRVQIAVNRRMVGPDHVLGDGDELALIPPVAGGSAPGPVAVTDTPLSLAEVVRYVEGAEQGAVVTFTGYVRRHGALPDVTRLEYEAYLPMALEVLTAIVGEIEVENPGVRVAVHHRIGTLAVGELAVAIAVSAPHRAEAFAACRVAIERLKQRAPIWKKEIGESGAVWVGSGP